MFDSDQHANYSSSGPDFPVQITHNNIFAVEASSTSQPRLVLAVEGAQAMGWNLLDNSWRRPVQTPVLEKLSSKEPTPNTGSWATGCA